MLACQNACLDDGDDDDDDDDDTTKTITIISQVFLSRVLKLKGCFFGVGLGSEENQRPLIFGFVSVAEVTTGDVQAR